MAHARPPRSSPGDDRGYGAADVTTSPEATPGARYLLSSSSALLASRLLMAALGWAGSVIIVRQLSTEDWGRFSFVFGFLGILSVLTDLGVGRVAIASLLEEGTDRRRSGGVYVLLRLLLGVAGYVLAVSLVAALGYPAAVVRAMAVAALVLVAASPANALEAIFQATFRLRTVAVAQTVAQLAQLALTAAIAVAGGKLLLFTIPFVVFSSVEFVYKWFALPIDVRPRLTVDLEAWKHLLREAAPLAIGGILSVAFYRIDIVLLSKLDSFTATGVYSIAYKFADVAHFAATALMVPVLPMLVRAWPDDLPSFSATLRRALVLCALVGALVLAEFVLFARPVITLLYGERYGIGAGAARLIVVGEVVHFATSLAFTTLVATGRHRQYPVIALGGVVANVALNVWLIPSRSFEGSAIATLVTEGLVALALGVIACRIPGVRPLPITRVVRCALAGALAMGAGALAWAVWPWWASAVVVAVVFAGAAHVAQVAGPGGLPALLRDEAVEA